MISTALIGIILLLTISISLAVYRIFKRGIEQNSNQQDVRFIYDYIFREIRNARVISPSKSSDITSYDTYCALTVKSVGNNKYLVKKTYSGLNNLDEINIGNPLKDLSFLPSDKDGKLRVSITVEINNTSYNQVFEFALENFDKKVISEETKTIYYVKYK